MKTKILNRVLAIVLLLALPVCIFGQMAVNDPLLNATLSLFKADAKLAQAEASVKMAESIAKTAQILQNVKMMVIKVDSFNSEVVDPLRDDYRFIKGLTENARWSDLWEAGEYVLGTSLNPT